MLIKKYFHRNQSIRAKSLKNKKKKNENYLREETFTFERKYYQMALSTFEL